MQLSHIDGWITLLCDQKVLYYCSGVFCFADCSDLKGVKVVFGRKCSVASCKPRTIDALHCKYMKAILCPMKHSDKCTYSVILFFSKISILQLRFPFCGAGSGAMASSSRLPRSGNAMVSFS